MLPSTFSSAVALFALGAGASGLYTVQACRDSTCSSCDDQAFAVTAGHPAVDAWPSLIESSASGIQTSQSTATDWPGLNETSAWDGHQVWLNVNQPDDTCQVVVYQTQPLIGEYSGGRIGNTILSTAHAGCFLTSMIYVREWYTTYCCGDCSPALPAGAVDIAAAAPPSKGPGHQVPTVGNLTTGGQPTNATRATAKVTTTARSTSTAITYWASHTALPSSKATATSASKLKIRGQTWTKRGERVDMCTDPLLEDTQHQFTCLNEPWTPSVSCGITPEPRQPHLYKFQMGGDQQILSSVWGSRPDHREIKSVVVTETLINLNLVAEVESHGINVTMHAGMDLLEEGGLSVSASTVFSDAWKKSIADIAGISHYTAEANNVPPVGEMASTFGYQWFTGTLDCDEMAITCNGMDMLIQKCSPSFEDGSTSAGGVYGYATIG